MVRTRFILGSGNCTPLTFRSSPPPIQGGTIWGDLGIPSRVFSHQLRDLCPAENNADRTANNVHAVRARLCKETMESCSRLRRPFRAVPWGGNVNPGFRAAALSQGSPRSPLATSFGSFGAAFSCTIPIDRRNRTSGCAWWPWCPWCPWCPW